MSNETLKSADLMPKIGKPLSRVDGRAKVTGTAKYTAEWQIKNLAYGVFATSSIAKGRITKLDTSEAKKVPGVLEVYTHENLPKLPQPFEKAQAFVGSKFLPMESGEIRYSNQPIALVVAETLEQATYAAMLIKAVYFKTGTPVAGLHAPNAKLEEPTRPHNSDFKPISRGDAKAALASAPVKVTAVYTHAINHHNAMEIPATIAVWEPDDHLTMYDTVQGISTSQGSLASILGLSAEKVRVVNKYLGGGFGSKGAVWPASVLTALAAKSLGRPLKVALTREQYFASNGHRDEQTQTLTLGADRSGKLLGIMHEKRSATSVTDDYAEANANLIDMLYACPAFHAEYKVVRANVLTPVFMRAPGEMPGAFALESAMDDLAAKLGLNPLDLRLRNYAETDPAKGKPFSSKSLRECYARGAELIGWSKRPKEARATRDGNWLIGWGMATAAYPVYSNQGNARARYFLDGTLGVSSGATDIGTGTYTICTQTASETFGIPMDKIKFELGDSTLPITAISGGSMAASSTTAAVHTACLNLKEKIKKFAVDDMKSPLHGASPDDVEIKDGLLSLKSDPAKTEKYAELLQRNQQAALEATGEGRYGASKEHSMHSFGVHFCQVKVDEELGLVRVLKWVGVHAAGRVLNEKTARSQMLGATAMGIGNALSEKTELDLRYARYVNGNLGEYHVAVNADAPSEVLIEFVPEEDPHVGGLGAKGMGELGMVGVSAAIGNAIFHATGKRLRDLPFTPDKVMA